MPPRIQLDRIKLGESVLLDSVTFFVTHLYRESTPNGKRVYALGLTGGGYLYSTEEGWFLKFYGKTVQSVKTFTWIHEEP